MKLKGISKLVLAGTALAATAATLTTATYAWYVTNSKVQATGVEGSVAGSAQGSLFIAPNTYTDSKDAPGVYVTKIELPNEANIGFQQTTGGLDAQSKAIEIENKYYFVTDDDDPDSSKTYYTIAGSTPAATAVQGSSLTEFAEGTKYYEQSASLVWVDKDGHALTSGRLLTFKYWLKSSAAGNAQITLKVDNTTATANSQKSLSGTGNPTSVTQGKSFTVDAVHALRMQIDKTPYTTDPQTAAMTAGTKTSVTYQVDAAGLGTYNTANTTAATRDSNPIAFVTGGDANQYFYSIMGYAPYGTADDGESTDTLTGEKPTTAVNVALEADKDTLLEFSIWLEGSDADCFDSCRGQSFSFDFEYNFTVSA